MGYTVTLTQALPTGSREDQVLPRARPKHSQPLGQQKAAGHASGHHLTQPVGNKGLGRLLQLPISLISWGSWTRVCVCVCVCVVFHLPNLLWYSDLSSRNEERVEHIILYISRN